MFHCGHRVHNGCVKTVVGSTIPRTTPLCPICRAPAPELLSATASTSSSLDHALIQMQPNEEHVVHARCKCGGATIACLLLLISFVLASTTIGILFVKYHDTIGV